MFRLSEDQAAELVEQPESGMGYQAIEANVDSATIFALAFNAELLVRPDELSAITGRPHDELLREAVDIQRFTLRAVLPAGAIGSTPAAVTTPPAAGAALAPTPLLSRTTSIHEGFIRFSAYSNDKRIRKNGSVAKNTYATTISDARFAVSGLAVAGRYALPNPSPAVYAYTIVPGPSVQYQLGTARPAYSQAGGGVELVFPAGAPAGSAFKPYEIPEK